MHHKPGGGGTAHLAAMLDVQVETNRLSVLLHDNRIIVLHVGDRRIRWLYLVVGVLKLVERETG